MLTLIFGNHARLQVVFVHRDGLTMGIVANVFDLYKLLDKFLNTAIFDL
jgi:hypothetical protein